MRAVDRIRPGERGAALLTVLLLVAIISVIAATALEKLRLSTRLAANAGAVEQARAYAQGAETLAQVRINDLMNRDAARTTLAGDWADKPYTLPIPDGMLTLRVHDADNCFNLNGLVTASRDANGNEIYGDNQAQSDVFARLMRLVGVPAQNAAQIAAATSDWIDSDPAPLPMGAEDTSYLGREPPYRTANTLMTDPSELRAVAGMTPEIYAKLKRWVCTLPQAKPNRINVNTLQPEDAPIFAMLLPNTLDLGQARAILMTRPAGGYESTVTFFNELTRRGISSGGMEQQVDVRSRWFALDVDVTVAGAQAHETALIDASGDRAAVVSRAWGDPA